eukprot:Blabericola_migrator_1__10678@NODE_6095_length_601_cov_159_363296_g4076_i0_p1_GENE_NODE_6095_length_601_cov_159_363296_g4076_i0NODE_6095_length_601_cov_159_363296_g4076_i0_p1_ORF_typecomplete_len110_score11_36RIH_assoc/PF08454_11/0_14_NODE_6095_length_601_cov_159_363296_g4076_i0230559
MTKPSSRSERRRSVASANKSLNLENRCLISRQLIESKLQKTLRAQVPQSTVSYFGLVVEGFLVYVVKAILRCAVESRSSVVTCRHVQIATMLCTTLRAFIYGPPDHSVN